MNNREKFHNIEIHSSAQFDLEFMHDMFVLPKVRWQKCLALYTYASECVGPIVELGTYHGCGTLALAAGVHNRSQSIVYTVDPFVTYDGWIGGEHYDESDLVIFRQNIMDSPLYNICLLRDSSGFVSEYFDQEYELLFWDICGDRMFSDYLDWYSLCAPGGRMIFKDLSNWQFGLDEVLDHALSNGFVIDSSYTPGLMWTIRRVS